MNLQVMSSRSKSAKPAPAAGGGIYVPTPSFLTAAYLRDSKGSGIKMVNVDVSGLREKLKKDVDFFVRRLNKADTDSDLCLLRGGCGSEFAMRQIQGCLWDMLMQRDSVFGTLVKITEPMQRLLHRAIMNGDKGAMKFFISLYSELRYIRRELEVVCISFDKPMQSLQFAAMHSGLYRFEKRQSVTSNGSIVTDNAEAVRIISCLEYASPGQLEQSGFPKVRLAVSRGQVTTDAEKIVRFFSAVSRAFRNLKEEGKGYVMSRDERRAILGWLQGMLPEDKRNGDKIGLEVCQDGFLRLFRRDLRKSGAPLFTATIYELRLDAKSGKVEGGGCGSAGEAEFCPCWACTSGRGETYGAGIVGGADYFRMVSFVYCCFEIYLCERARI